MWNLFLNSHFVKFRTRKKSLLSACNNTPGIYFMPSCQGSQVSHFSLDISFLERKATLALILTRNCLNNCCSIRPSHALMDE